MEANTDCMVTYIYKNVGPSGYKFEVREAYNVDNFPPAMRKKCLLFKHFRTYLKSKLSQQLSHNSGINNEETVFVKKWLRTPLAIFFRLSNGLVQVNFKDNTIMYIT